MDYLRILFYLTLLIVVSGIAFAADPYRHSQGFDVAYDISKGEGIVVAVISGGVDMDHVELKHAIWINEKEKTGTKKDDDKNGYIDDIYGWNFVDKSNDLKPKTNFGTNIAGVIAAKDDNRLGISGIAPRAKIMSLVACDAKACHKSAIIEAIDYASENGANIIVFGLNESNFIVHSKDYDKAIENAYNKGVLIIAPAGNGDVKSTKNVGKNLDIAKYSPVANEDSINMVLGVGASYKSSAMPTNWTNYGGRYVDVFAPGQDITTTTVPALSNKQEYAIVSNTGIAAAVVAGSAALLMDRYPHYPLYQIISRLKNTNPFSPNILLTRTVYSSHCVINYVNKEVVRGDKLVLPANDLDSSVVLYLRGVINGSFMRLADVRILDYNSIEIDTAKIPVGMYYLLADNCIAEGRIIIKEKVKSVTPKIVPCDVKNVSFCDRSQLLELIKQLLKNINK